MSVSQLKVISTRKMPMRLMCTISNAMSAEASVVAVLMSSEYSEYSDTMVMKTWNCRLLIMLFSFFWQSLTDFYYLWFM